MNFERPPYSNKTPNQTFEVPYSSSTLNPVQRNVNNILVNIDSIFKKNNNNSNDFIFEFQTPLKNIISYEVNSIELPNTWYNISSNKKNNEFTIKVHNYNDGSNNFFTTEHTIVLPEGNYTLEELTNTINNYFNTTKQGLDYLYFDINPISMKSIIRFKDITDNMIPLAFNNSAFNIYYSPNLYFEVKFDLIHDIQLLNNNSEFITRNVNRNFGFLLGFTENYYKVTKDNKYTNSFNDSAIGIEYCGYLQSECVYGETIDKYIFLSIDDFNNNYNENFYTSNENMGNTSNIVAKIPLSSPSFSIINQVKGDLLFREKRFYGPVDIKKLKIKLINKYGELVDLIHNNYSFTLQFKQIYS